MAELQVRNLSRRWRMAGRKYSESTPQKPSRLKKPGITEFDSSRNNAKVVESAMPHLIRSRMAMLAMDQCYQAAALGKASGKVRFNLINGYIIQKLLFSRHLTRKPASLKWFRFWWRFVSQKRLLMPLVQPRGIYCFYSQELMRNCVL